MNARPGHVRRTLFSASARPDRNRRATTRDGELVGRRSRSFRTRDVSVASVRSASARRPASTAVTPRSMICMVELFGTSSPSTRACASASAAAPVASSVRVRSKWVADESRIGLQNLLEQLDRLLIAPREVVDAAESRQDDRGQRVDLTRAQHFCRSRDRSVRARRDTSRTSAAFGHDPDSGRAPA